MKILASTENSGLRSAALRVVGNVLTGDELQTQAVLDLDVCPIFLSLLSNPKPKIKKETCWSISNITAGTAKQIQAVIDVGLFPEIITLGYTAPSDLRKECIWCLSNATEQGEATQIQYLVDHDIVPFLVWTIESQDYQILHVVLAALYNICKVDETFAAHVQQKAESQILDCTVHAKSDVVKIANEIKDLFPNEISYTPKEKKVYGKPQKVYVDEDDEYEDVDEDEDEAPDLVSNDGDGDGEGEGDEDDEESSLSEEAVDGDTNNDPGNDNNDAGNDEEGGGIVVDADGVTVHIEIDDD